MSATDITACIVTRGNVDLAPIIDSLIFERVIVWDNSTRPFDVKTYGRSLAADEADTDLVYFQDDDVIVPAQAQEQLVERHQNGVLISNMEDTRNRREFPELTWVGWGAITDRDLYRQAFRRWQQSGGQTTTSDFRLVGCDIVFSILNPDSRRVDLGFSHLDYALDEDRAYRTPGFQQIKHRFYEAALTLANELEEVTC